jgi:AcrR family transcriptional regulator
MPRLTAGARRALTEDRRAQILSAAEAVFASRGYHGATMRAIARRAGLAEGTIYLYFRSKRGLLLAAWEHIALSSLAPLLHRADGSRDDEAFMTALLADRLAMIRRHSVFLRLVMHQADLDPVIRKTLRQRFHAIRNIVSEHLQRRIADGAFRPVAVAIVIRAIAGLMVGLALMDAHDRESLFTQHPAGAVAGEVARLILHGLSVDSGRADRSTMTGVAAR